MRGSRLVMSRGCAATMVAVLAAVTGVAAQQPGEPSGQLALFPEVGQAVRFAVSPAAADLPAQDAPAAASPGRVTTAGPSTPADRSPATRTTAAVQDVQRHTPSGIPVPALRFNGLSSQDDAVAFGTRSYPADPTGDVGPNHYVQAVNNLVRVYSKSGVTLATFTMSSLFAALGGLCATNDDGDPTALYDPLADRWLLSQVAFDNRTRLPPYHQCVAISKTGDPTGAYFLYDFLSPGDNFNDYSKFGVWSDAYYMTDHQFLNDVTFNGVGAFAFDRARMLAGDPTAAFVYFSLPTTFSGMLPADVDGLAPPPAGAPNYFAMFAAKMYGEPFDAIRLFSFHADFANPGASTFTERPESPIAVAAFDPRSPDGTNVIEQPSPATASSYLDAIQGGLMQRLAYRNFNSLRESLVVTHTVNVGADPSTPAGHQAAVRYYELRRILPGGSFTVPEQATFAPDTDNRWMGSAAMDRQGNIAVGYSVSSLTTYPSIRYAGRLATDPPNGLFQGEAVLVGGTGVQLDTEGRWGDYSAMSVDPADDCTFWYTNMYYTAASQASSSVGWLTRVGTFKFQSCGAQSPLGTIAGRVTDVATTAPVSGSVLGFSPGGYAVVTDGNGVYSATLPPAMYTVTASAAKHSSESVFGVVATDGSSTSLDFALPLPPNTGTVTGHVRQTATTTPLANALVSVSPGGTSTTTDASGRYALTLAAGTYTVTASAAGFRSASVSGVTTSNQAETVANLSLGVLGVGLAPELLSAGRLPDTSAPRRPADVVAQPGGTIAMSQGVRVGTIAANAYTSTAPAATLTDTLVSDIVQGLWTAADSTLRAPQAATSAAPSAHQVGASLPTSHDGPSVETGPSGTGPVGPGVVDFPAGLTRLRETRSARRDPDRKWEVEVFGGGMLAMHTPSGTASPFDSAVTFTMANGQLSRRVSSWYAGDGAALLNQTNAALGVPQRVTPLDAVLDRPMAERQAGATLGARVSHIINPRFAAELSVAYARGPVDVTPAGLAGIEASRSTFVAAWNGLIAAGSFSNAGVTSVSTVNAAGSQLVTTGAVNIALKTTGKTIPYVTLGAGVTAHAGEASATLVGQYQFSIGGVTPVNETDAVTLRYATPSVTAVGIIGGGVRYYATPRWGVRLDVRGHVSPGRIDTLVDLSPAVSTLTPAGSGASLTNPGIQFSNDPAIAVRSSLGGPAVTGVRRFSGAGTLEQVSLTMGVFWRF